MNYSLNHNIEVGEIISSDDEQVAIADSHEIWEHDKDDIRLGKFKTVGEATIRIASGGSNGIHTNWMRDSGVVCFLPKEYKGCGILKVRITRISNKSVEAIPIDYIKDDDPLMWIFHGMEVNKILQEATAYPNMIRIQEE